MSARRAARRTTVCAREGGAPAVVDRPDTIIERPTPGRESEWDLGCVSCSCPIVFIRMDELRVHGPATYGLPAEQDATTKEEATYV